MDGHIRPHQQNCPGCTPVTPRKNNLSADTETGNMIWDNIGKCTRFLSGDFALCFSITAMHHSGKYKAGEGKGIGQACTVKNCKWLAGLQGSVPGSSVNMLNPGGGMKRRTAL